MSFGLNRGLIVAAAIASASIGAIGVATKNATNNIQDFATAIKSLKGRYRFTPYTDKNIGKSYYKRGSIHYSSENGAREIQRRLSKLGNYSTQGSVMKTQSGMILEEIGPAYCEVKITPRRGWDFTGSQWNHALNVEKRKMRAQIKKERTKRITHILGMKRLERKIHVRA